MANKKITELDAATSLASTDVVPVVDVSADVTKKITTTNLFRTLPDGTAAAPALAFSSDAANGIYLAGTDTVGISTGGTQRVTVDGSGNVTISGNLQVDGATTTVQSTTVTIDDKNLELGSVASPSNTTADGGGITLKGATDKTLKWINSTGCWTFNQPMNFNDHVRIDSSGRVAIGGTVVTDSNLLNLQGSSVSSNIGVVFNDTNTSQIFGIQNGGSALKFFDYTASAERLRINANGELISVRGSFLRDVNTGELVLAGGNATNAGANIKLFGGSHASTPNILVFRRGSTESMRIDSSGNIGAGTTSPQANLDIAPASSSATLRVHARSNTSAVPAIELVRGTNTTFGADVYQDYRLKNSAGRLILEYGQSGATTEALRIDSVGRLLLGTTTEGDSDADNLTVADSSHCGITIRSGGTSTGSIFFSDATSGTGEYDGFLVYNQNDRNLKIGTAASTRLTIDSSGRCGIGTTTPQEKFVVSNGGAEGVEITAGATSNLNKVVHYNRSGAAYTSARVDAAEHIFRIGSSEKLRIDSSGNVGIGTSSPSTNLEIVVASGTAKQQLGSSSVSGGSYTNYHGASGTKTWFVGSNYNVGGALEFFQSTTNGGTTPSSTPAMLIDSSGRLLVGTTSAVDSGATSSLQVVNTSTAIIALGRNDSSISAGNDLGAIRFYGNDGGSYQQCAEIVAEADGDHANNDKPTRLVFSTTADSGSSPTERLRIDSSGNTILGYAGASLYFKNGFNNSVSRIQNGGGSNSSNFKFLVENSGSESEAMRIDSSGRVGIGTSSPGHLLTLKGTQAFEATNSTNDWLAYTYTDNTFRLNYNGAGADEVVITSAGNVGIGSTAPGHTLEVKGSFPDFAIVDSDTTNDKFRILHNGGGTQLMVDPNNVGPNASYFLVSVDGSEAARIDSSGRLLVGTTSNFGDNSTGDALQVATTAGGHLLLGRNDSSVSANNTIGLIRGYSYGGSAWQETARISIQADGDHASGDKPGRIVLATTADGASSPTERLRITSTGAWAIEGASNYGTSGQVLTSNGNDSPTWQSPGAGAQISAGNTNVECVDTGSNGHIMFDTEGSERMRIDSSGQVVIKNSSNAYLNLTKTDEGNGSFEFDGSTFDITSNSSSAALTFGTASTERMRINHQGRVSIGTTTAAHAPLHVHSSTTAAYFHLTNSTTGSSASDGFSLFSTGNDIVLDQRESANMRFFTANSERMRIDSTGRVGIGASTMYQPFEVKFSDVNTSFQGNGSGGDWGLGSRGMMIENDTATGGAKALVQYRVGDADYFAGIKRVGSNAASFIFQRENNSPDVTFDSSGRVGIGETSMDGLLVIKGDSNASSMPSIRLKDGTDTREAWISNTAGDLVLVNGGNDDVPHCKITLFDGNIMTFATGNTERMRINSDGHILFGQSTTQVPGLGNTTAGCAYEHLGSNGGAFFASRSGGPAYFGNRNDDGIVHEFRRSGNLVGSISVNSSVTAFNTSSDHRLKENIVALSGAITRVKQLAPKRFNFIVDPAATVDGFLAHEAATVVPEAVTGTHNEVDAENNPVYQGIDQSKLVPLLTAALQEAIAKIETLETKVAALEAS